MTALIINLVLLLYICFEQSNIKVLPALKLKEKCIFQAFETFLYLKKMNTCDENNVKTFKI